MHSDNSPSIIMQWQPALETDWLIVDIQQKGNGTANMHSALTLSSESTSGDAVQRDTVLIIPAELAFNARIFVPSAKSAHIQAAVPHLMEEWTLGELDTLHLSIGERSDSGHIAVSAVDRELIVQALKTVESPLNTCSAIYVDAALLPHAPNTLTLFIDRERALFRWNGEQAGAIEITAFIPFLSALFHQCSFSEINLSYTAQTQLEYIDALVQRILSAHPQSIINRQPVIVSLIHFYAERIKTAHEAVNLRQGKFALERSHAKHWQRWKPLAIAAAVCVLIQMSLNFIIGWQLNQKAKNTHEQAAMLYHELFPNDKRIVNIRQQFQNHLNNDTGTDQKPFFTLFGDLTREIRNTSADKPIQLRSLVYDKKSTGLQVELIVPSVPILDDLQKRLSVTGNQAKITSAANADGVVIGRLNLAGKS